ncbi:restriction endonuclease subunit S [Escherichia coli O73]|uniref:restriction endonuclease subunit S n=1 Tax=Escherichia coli TaxID=562 RepID=UPI000BE327A2|nr:restriction endonuclease subunit S [Escherichia coli]EFH4279488.1 restriction endonuclease subunit S [Escherichia coli]EFO3067632.1 restriction endonuclease subunit S [Escherichia coli O73]MGT25675.1 restriction endonuclease subunit S [Escherichia coli]HBA8411175.1 restriction endonuclease subunit S [Escherichia coli]
MSNAVSFLKYGDVAEFRNGLNFSKDSHGKGCKFIGVADFKDNFTPQWELLGEINPFGVAKREDYLEPGDIIFVRSNGNKALVGRSLYIDLNEKSLYSGFCIRARLKTDDFLPLFLAYYTRTNFFKSAITSVAGTNINNLNQDILGNIMIPHYSIGIQKSIVAVLTSIDEKIAINNRINAELEAMAKMLYDYWFVQFNFPDANGKPYKSSGGKMEYNAALEQEIPAGWSVDTLSSWIADDKTGDWGKEIREGNYTLQVNCIRGADINGLNGYGNTSMPVRYILEKNKKKLLSAYDFVIEISGGSPTQSTGRMAFITKEMLDRFTHPVICSNFCKAITLKDNLYSYNFFYTWNDIYNKGILFGWEGKTSGIKNLLFDSFVNKHHVCVPHKGLVKIFHDIMMPLHQKKQKNLKENSELQKLRDWLLPLLMNGQVKAK